MSGILGEFGSLAVGVAVVAITLIVAFIIMSQGVTQIQSIENHRTGNETLLKADHDASYAYNSTVTLQEAANDVPGWIPLVIIAGVGIVILGMVRKFQ